MRPEECQRLIHNSFTGIKQAQGICLRFIGQTDIVG